MPHSHFVTFHFFLIFLESFLSRFFCFSFRFLKYSRIKININILIHLKSRKKKTKKQNLLLWIHSWSKQEREKKSREEGRDIPVFLILLYHQSLVSCPIVVSLWSQAFFVYFCNWERKLSSLQKYTHYFIRYTQYYYYLGTLIIIIW